MGSRVSCGWVLRVRGPGLGPVVPETQSDNNGKAAQRSARPGCPGAPPGAQGRCRESGLWPSRGAGCGLSRRRDCDHAEGGEAGQPVGKSPGRRPEATAGPAAALGSLPRRGRCSALSLLKGDAWGGGGEPNRLRATGCLPDVRAHCETGAVSPPPSRPHSRSSARKLALLPGGRRQRPGSVRGETRSRGRLLPTAPRIAPLSSRADPPQPVLPPMSWAKTPDKVPRCGSPGVVPRCGCPGASTGCLTTPALPHLSPALLSLSRAGTVLSHQGRE